jgi:succinyl-diaminopimelate desuccinylase
MTGPRTSSDSAAADAVQSLVDADGVVAFARDLVRTRSVHDPENGCGEAAAAAVVEAKMREFGWTPVVTQVAQGRPNVVAVIDGGGGAGPALAFVGHTDVVTEGAAEAWTVDPYGGEIRDGRLYGRGAADMKSGLAAMLYAVRALQRSGPFPGRVTVCALVDEEGLMLGVKQFAASDAAVALDGAIVGEPEGGEICLCAKGAIRVRVDLRGAMAHGAMPQHGRNPIAAAGRLLAALTAYQEELTSRHGAHEHLGSVFLTPTVVRAGSVAQLNVIPAHCTVGIDVRTIPGVDHGMLRRRIRLLAERAGEPDGVRATTTVLDDRPPVQVGRDEPVAVAVAEAHEAIVGEPPRYGGVPGTTDGTILTTVTGVPTVVYGPGGKWMAHRADEFVEVAEIVRYTRVYAEAARRFLTGRRG